MKKKFICRVEVKIALLIVKNVFFGVGKGISEFWRIKHRIMNNRMLLNSSIKYIESSKRFSGPLF